RWHSRQRRLERASLDLDQGGRHRRRPSPRGRACASRRPPAGSLWTHHLFSPPSARTVAGITSGPDGNLWFTEEGYIGRVTPSSHSAVWMTGRTQLIGWAY